MRRDFFDSITYIISSPLCHETKRLELKGLQFNRYPAAGPYMGREQFWRTVTKPGGLVEALTECASGLCSDAADQTFLLDVS